MSQSGESGANEAKIDGRAVFWKSPALWVGVLAAVGCLGYGIYAVTGFFSKDRDAKAVVDGPVRSAGSLAYKGRNSVRVAGPAWRITGEVVGGGMDKVFLEDGSRYVILDIWEYCQRDLAGFLVCHFEGQRISNQIQYLPEAQRPAVAVPALFPEASSSAASEGL